MGDIAANMDESIVLLFKNETREQLERFTEILLGLEQNPDKQGEVINELFRLAHNIKGSSGMMGLNVLKDTMHSVENLLDGVRKTVFHLDEAKIDALIQYCDEVLDYIEGGCWNRTEGISRWKEEFNYQIEREKLPKDRFNNVLSLTDSEKQEIALWQRSGKEVYGVEVQFSLDAAMKSASALVFVKYIEKYGSIFKMVPSLKELGAEKFDIFKAVLMVETPLTPEQEKTIITYPINDALETRLRKWVYRPEEAKTSTDIKPEHEDHLAVASIDRTIRVESSKIDQLLNNVGELLNIKANLVQLTQSDRQGDHTWDQLTKTVQKLEQVTASFQENIIDLRMVPVRQLFSRFPKIIRDVAKKRGKLVELTVFGEETKIDKQMAENLVDPLTHIIRNAVDHGLESREQRLAAGKTEVGRIKIGAYQDGDYIVISVGDDGKGLDVEKIKENAVKNGVIKANEKISDEEAYKLIFAPGFSTADTISDISGRGVGLDVVLSSINALKGDVEVDTRLNQGTTFNLKVPLTLAIIQALLVKAGDQPFAIPSGDVLESLMIEKGQIRNIALQKVFTLRQEAFPIIDLRQLFGFEKAADMEEIPLVVIKNGRSKTGLIVDELIGQEEIVIKQINPAFPNTPMIAGAAILGGGEIALIINTHDLQTN